ncbi:MAG: nucleotidyltransferase domain-containing protein [Chloroflexota bacterium]
MNTSPLTGKTKHKELVLKRYHEVIQALERAFGEQLKTIVLFGSQVHGEQRSDSDHDLFVVIENLPRDPLARQRTVRMTLLPILDRLPGLITFIAKTPCEFEANLTPLLLDVCADGICLFGDLYFEPYRQRALNAIQQAGLQRKKTGGKRMWLFPQIPNRDWELTWEGFREYTR